MSKMKPEIRFGEFADAWEKRKLEDLADVRDGTHNSPQYYSEGHPLITSKNVKNGFINYDDIQYISDGDFEEINRRSKVDKNDILMGMIGTIGNIALVRETPDFAIKNVALIKDIEKVYCVYLYHYLQSSSILNQLSEGMDGGTQKFIALNKIRNLIIAVPRIEEQYKISNYMEHLDNLITLHQRKLDKMKNLKSAYLSKMFPKEGERYPRLRFAGFTDAWEQRKLGDITESFSGGTPSAGNSQYYGGTIPFIRSGEISSDKTELFVTEAGLNNSSAKMVKVGDVLYALYGATSGEVSISRINGAINQAILAIRSTRNDDHYIIAQWLRMQKEAIISTYLQGGQGNLSGSIVKELMISLPADKKEQKLISSFFHNLDNLITLHQRELEKLKQLKQAMLQKMFV